MPEPQSFVEQELDAAAAAESADPAENSPYLPEPIRQEYEEVRSLSLLPAVKTFSPDPDSSDPLRERAQVEAHRFNNPDNWPVLARVLAQIRSARAYERWGYETFSAYAKGELNITKATASSLVSAFDYLATRHPEYLLDDTSLTVKLKSCPPYSSIAALARNHKFLSPNLRETLDEELFSEGLTRAALLEAIASARAERIPEPAGRPQRRVSRRLLQEVEALFQAVDLKMLWKTTTDVIEAWETDSQAERRDLLIQVNELFQQLCRIEELLQDAPV